MARSKRNFDKQFKQDSVNYYYSSNKPLSTAASDINIAESTLRDWVNQAKKNEGLVPHRGSGNHASDEQKEIARLKKELRDHKDALDVLKKAINILND